MYSDVALLFDAEEKVVPAAWGYELALLQDRLGIDLRLELVALYLMASDPGFSAAKGLEQPFVDVAYYRAKSLLEEGLNLHPEHPELLAWQYHLNERVIGSPIDLDVIRRLADDPRGEFARLLLYVASDRQEHRIVIEALFRRAATRYTSRSRYYMSYAPRGLTGC